MTEPIEQEEEELQLPVLRSEVEFIKEASNRLRGTIKETLEGDDTHFSEDEYQLLKFHGIYQQDDRDGRTKARKEKREKDWIMMIRAKIPGGELSADQYLMFDDVAERYANNTLRITTRQVFQLHYIHKGELKQTMQEINAALITTLGACGDIERNLMACPAPDHRGAATEVQRYARALSDASLPQTRAYHEIWLDHEMVYSSAQPEVEPLYGDLYLPRKFKSGIAIEGDNCIDVYSQDVGMVAHLDDDQLAGFTILAGGGMGKTHTDPNTRPRVGDPICFVKPDQLIETFLGIIKVQRDNGNRASRRQARLKYLIANNGVDRFRNELQRYVGRRLDPPRDLHWEGTVDHMGWHEQHDGRYYLGVWVENGRIQDGEGGNYKTAFRELMKEFRPGVVLTAQQSILFTNVEERQRSAIDALLRSHGVRLTGEVSNALRYSMACPATPTCGLALAESERALPSVIRQIEADLQELGLADERLSVRMTGCPNGCARPYLGDIGFVGRTPGKYQLYVGGDFEGTHLNRILADMVPTADLARRLRPMFALFKDERDPSEGFGDFCYRVGVERLRAVGFPETQTVGAAR
ncbi:MAG: NADPH-dependent assimilatory sulfite reductase hemoprotein subunit [Chloroflexi bacterium]|nr:NADPH-dependent assimilatory sulfite reductase hemoprotein subunit [Chloroflexota bacterium]